MGSATGSGEMIGRVGRKIFGVGYHRTGTMTLQACFRTLGFTETGFNFKLTADLVATGAIEPVLAHARGFESFQDWPWPLCFREVDREFPGSRFVLTTRESGDRWFASLMDHYEWVTQGGADRFLELFRLLYGPEFPHNRSACIEKYERHNQEVRDFFRGSERLLEVCWEKGDGWEVLCAFVGRPVPAQPFPKINRFSVRSGGG